MGVGNFLSAAWKGIKWCGNCIGRVVDWWRGYKDEVNQKTFNFIQGNQNVILSANNPRGVCEVCVINSEKQELEDISDYNYKTLTSDDRYRIDSLLARRDYF